MCKRAAVSTDATRRGNDPPTGSNVYDPAHWLSVVARQERIPASRANVVVCAAAAAA